MYGEWDVETRTIKWMNDLFQTTHENNDLYVKN